MNVCSRRSRPRSIICLIAVGIVVFVAIPANAHTDESPFERYQRAIRDVGQFCENMNDRWFAAAVTRTYFGKDGTPYTLERLNIVYRSQSILYINSQKLMTSRTKFHTPTEHIELISTDEWTIMINHHSRGPHRPQVKIAAANTRAARMIEDSLRTESDITLRFGTRIQQTTTHEYAAPRLDERGRLVVQLDRTSYVNDSDVTRMQTYPILEVTYAGESGIRPVVLRSILTDEEGKQVQTSKSEIHYARNSDGQPILQSQRYQSTRPGKPQETWDFRVRETSRPEWCDWPPRISVPTGPLVVQKYTDSGTTTDQESDLPVETAPLFQQLDEAELKAKLQQQLDTLNTVQDYVTAIPLNTLEQAPGNSSASVIPELKSTYTVPVVLGCMASCLFACWLVVWFRWHSAKL